MKFLHCLSLSTLCVALGWAADVGWRLIQTPIQRTAFDQPPSAPQPPTPASPQGEDRSLRVAADPRPAASRQPATAGDNTSKSGQPPRSSPNSWRSPPATGAGMRSPASTPSSTSEGLRAPRPATELRLGDVASILDVTLAPHVTEQELLRFHRRSGSVILAVRLELEQIAREAAVLGSDVGRPQWWRGEAGQRQFEEFLQRFNCQECLYVRCGPGTPLITRLAQQILAQQSVPADEFAIYWVLSADVSRGVQRELQRAAAAQAQFVDNIERAALAVSPAGDRLQCEAPSLTFRTSASAVRPDSAATPQTAAHRPAVAPPTAAVP